MTGTGPGDAARELLAMDEAGTRTLHHLIYGMVPRSV